MSRQFPSFVFSFPSSRKPWLDQTRSLSACRASWALSTLQPSFAEEIVEAVRTQNLERLHLFLCLGGDPNVPVNRVFPLILAVQLWPQERAVVFTRLLLQHGADPNVKEPSLQTSPLIAAASRWQREEIFELLLSFGANPNLPDIHGSTPLFAVVQDPNGERKLPLLLVNGANVNHQNNAGFTPLMLAAQTEGRFVLSLLANGAKVNLRNACGRTALWYAAKQAHWVKRALLDAGAVE